ncbi:MAG: VWA domain-containing protein [Halobacteriovoraceae bacterium]|nr:VWA domain-containing protein [Halobacteriovoraceae bacterium]
MNFVYSQYIYALIFGVALLFYFTLKSEKNFFEWVKTYWFYKRSLKNRIASWLWLVGIALLAISVLDLRGPEKKLQGDVSEQKTIILIDSSLSMLAEDIRPNRYDRAIFIARHFVKKAAGHKMSVVIFSDTHKKLVPFTSDFELLDARIAALKDIGVSGGGTGLKQAIQESLIYLGGDREKIAGNILIITDAEETDKGFDLKIPDSVTLAVVGVGTAKGSVIPLRDNQGVSRGYKEYKGEKVVSKLDEATIKEIGDSAKYFKYWIASSYSLPTDEILNFFSQSLSKKISQDEVLIKPVFTQYILIPAIILLIVSYALKLGSPFVLNSLLLGLFFFSGEQLRAQTPSGNSTQTMPQIPEQLEQQRQKEEEEKQKLVEEKSKEINVLLDKWKKEGLDSEEKSVLASKLLVINESQKAENILEKNLKDTKINEENKTSYFNLATSNLQNKNFDKAIHNLKDLGKYLKENPSSENQDLLKKVHQNTLLAIKKQKQEKQKQKQQQGDQGKDKKQQSQQSSGKDKKDQKNKDQQQKDQNQDQGDQNKDQDQKMDQDKQSDKDKKKKKKIPGLLKQLINEDRELQKKLLDTSTQDKKNMGPKKDW